MPRRGAPPIPVRAWPEALKPWQEAAKREGLTLSAWVHRTLNLAVGLTVEGKPKATDPANCPHPRTERQRKPYGTICGQCGTLVGIGR